LEVSLVTGGLVLSRHSNLKVRDIHRLHIKQLLASAMKRNGDPLSKNSRRLIRATLSVLLGDAVEAGIISANPVLGLARKGRKQPDTLSPSDRLRTIRPMTHDQLAQFLRAANRHCAKRDAVLFHTLADTGMRPGEALALQWRDVNITRRTVEVEGTKTGERRTVVLTTPLTEALSSWQASCEAEALTAKDRSARTPSEHVFPSRTRQPLNVKTIGRRFRALLRLARLPRFKLYDLRHTYATQLLQEAPLTFVAKQLGHRKPTTTLQFYAHWLPQDDTPYLDRLTAARQAAGDLSGDFVRTKTKR
jgi:integrase